MNNFLHLKNGERLTPEQFTFWLQGFCELSDGKRPSTMQWKLIKEHLELCFEKTTSPHFVPDVPNQELSALELGKAMRELGKEPRLIC